MVEVSDPVLRALYCVEDGCIIAVEYHARSSDERDVPVVRPRLAHRELAHDCGGISSAIEGKVWKRVVYSSRCSTIEGVVREKGRTEESLIVVLLGQDRDPCGIQGRETTTKVQLKLYMQPLSSPLPTTNGTIYPRIFPPTPLQILAQTPVGMGLTDRAHTRSGQSKRSLRSSGEPQAPVGQSSPLGMSTVSLVALTEEYIKNHGIEIFRQSVASPFGRDCS